MNLCPLHWKCGVLTAGPPGKSRKRILRQAFPKQNASQASFVPFRYLYPASPACHALSLAAGALAASTSGGNPCPCGADTLVDMPTTVYTTHPARERQTQECTCVRAYEHTVMSRAPTIRQSYICSFIHPCRPLVSSCRWSPSSELALG